MIAPHKTHLILEIILALMAVIIAVLCVLLAGQYQHIRQLNYISPHRQSFLRSLQGSGPLSAADASSTQSWMTFNYVDRAFSLPPTYLQMNLNVSDSRYPNMTIMEYAKDAGLSPAAALSKVQTAIGAYFSAKQ